MVAQLTKEARLFDTLKRAFSTVAPLVMELPTSLGLPSSIIYIYISHGHFIIGGICVLILGEFMYFIELYIY